MTGFTGRCFVTETATAQSPLLVFADDWGRHPSSCQHLTRHLLGSHEVYWVNTIGTRSPRLDLATLYRGLEKLQHWSRPAASREPLPSGLHVLNPRMWPWFGSRLSRHLNRTLLRRQLAPLVRSLPEVPVAVTTLPVVADLVGVLPVRRWVYYCVDDFGEWPGLDQDAMRWMDDLLIARADVLVAVSDTLRDRMRARGREAHLLTHGVDLDFWSGDGAPEAVPGLEGLERPLVVFWGVVDRRLDVSFLRRLAAELKGGTIVLAGPEADPDAALRGIPGVVCLGSLPYGQLPQLAREASVLIMPYADLPVTRAMQPLKLKEYLATGRPTVVRRLPATEALADCLDQADSPEAFAAAVRRRLAAGLPEQQARARARLSSESWQEKALALERWALGPDVAAGVAYDS
jgi:glycosyltransferase involved in cell wall biosynthesis